MLIWEWVFGWIPSGQVLDISSSPTTYLTKTKYQDQFTRTRFSNPLSETKYGN